MLETHLLHILRNSRMKPAFFIRSEIFPKASKTRRNASRRLFGLSSLGRPYNRIHWPELLYHSAYRSYHAAYMRMWRKKNRQNRCIVRIAISTLPPHTNFSRTPCIER
jgi:hypothetical protein